MKRRLFMDTVNKGTRRRAMLKRIVLTGVDLAGFGLVLCALPVRLTGEVVGLAGDMVAGVGYGLIAAVDAHLPSKEAKAPPVEGA
jgi:hypothetical protein